MKELLELRQAFMTVRQIPYAVATVVRVDGSSYRRPGARMLMSAQGRITGSVSGGCLEKDVVSKGLRAIMNDLSCLLTYDTTDQDDMALGTSLGCEGQIDVLLETVPPRKAWPMEAVIAEILARREPAAVVMLFRKGSDSSGLRIERGVSFDGKLPVLSGRWSADVLLALKEDVLSVFATRKTKTRCFSSPGEEVQAVIEWIRPPPSLFIFGAGHDAPPLVRLAKELGFEVTVVDRRPDFAIRERYPQADGVVCAKPHEVAQRLHLTSGSLAVIMNHHYVTDRDLLRALLPLGIIYIGMLGPRKRTDRILRELEADGLSLSPKALTSLYAPAGLDIGSENPEQIALSILAEIQATLSGRSAASLRTRQAPIHADGPSLLPCNPLV